MRRMEVPDDAQNEKRPMAGLARTGMTGVIFNPIENA